MDVINRLLAVVCSRFDWNLLKEEEEEQQQPSRVLLMIGQLEIRSGRNDGPLFPGNEWLLLVGSILHNDFYHISLQVEGGCKYNNNMLVVVVVVERERPEKTEEA